MIEQSSETYDYPIQYTGIEIEEDFFGDYGPDEEKYR